MDHYKLKEVVKTIAAMFVVFLFIAVFISFPSFAIELEERYDPSLDKGVMDIDSFETEITTYTGTIGPDPETILELIPDYVTTPEGGTPWKMFGATKEHEYSYTDEDGFEWTGIRPEFSEELKKLDQSNILIQGYMFPLSQDEKQSMFLFGPFPMSCPYHYHVPPRLLIEVHAKNPITFSYDAINIQGQLELVSEDIEYDMFFRLKNVEIVN